jgi:two-component system, LuxR family, response regulator FixJ
MLPESEPTVFIVDDDKTICSGISQMVETIGLKTECFTSAQQFLDSHTPGCAGCLVLDVRMPGMSGLALQDILAAKNENMPIIFITGHGSVRMGVEAVKKGAIDYIEKPFDDQVLLDQIQIALEKDAKNRQIKDYKHIVFERIESLTPREQQIMHMVANGKLNKGMAYELEISIKTVEYHRSNVMKRMQIDSVAELVKLLDHAGVL